MPDAVLVVDASVAVKWYVDEPDSPAADAVLAGGAALIAPDILFAEVPHALTRHLRRGQLGLVRRAVDDLRAVLPAAVPSRTLLPRAVELSLELGHAIYDCFYLALAERWEARVVTADRALLAKLAGTPHAGLARALDEFAA